jgi:hypothetical protein
LRIAGFLPISLERGGKVIPRPYFLKGAYVKAVGVRADTRVRPCKKFPVDCNSVENFWQNPTRKTLNFEL